MTTTHTIRERVAAGASALDAEMPGWVDRVDLTTLCMAAACDCILGQAFGDYWEAPFGDEYDDPERRRADLGFQAYSALTDDSCVAEYADLHAEWTRVVLARRTQAGAR